MQREIIDFLLLFPEFKLDNGNLYKNNEIYYPATQDFNNVVNTKKYPLYPSQQKKFDIFISTNNIKPEDIVIINKITYDNPINVVVGGSQFVSNICNIGILTGHNFMNIAASSKVVLCFDPIEKNSLIFNNILATTNFQDVDDLLQFSIEEKDNLTLSLKKNLITDAQFRNSYREAGL